MDRIIEIAGRPIGGDSPAYVSAEHSANHNQDFDQALREEGITCAGCHVRDGVILGPFDDAVAPHPTQFDPKSPYFDPASKPDAPRWLLVDVQVLQKIPTITLPALRDRPELAELLVLKKGNRLSITPVEAGHWQSISKLADNPAPGHA